MITQAELLRLATNKWPAYLEAVAQGASIFPLRIRFGQPRHTAELAELMRDTQTLIAGSKEKVGRGYTVKCEPIKTRRYGVQPLPVEVSFVEEGDYVRFLGKDAEAKRFRANIALSEDRCPGIRAWLERNAPKVVAHADDWPGLMSVCVWFVRHPRPQCYAREIPVPVHTKFIEEHQPILRSLLEFLLPNDFDPEAPDFFTRFYLRDKEPMVRIRVLDPKLATLAGLHFPDFRVPVSSLNLVPLRGGGRFVVTENETPLLTLPPIDAAVAVFGGGNAVKLLAAANWMAGAGQVLYWGDIDYAGFGILGRLRTVLPQVRSALMDLPTFEAYPWAQVPDTSGQTGAIPQDILTDAEWKCWRHIAAAGRRLEQERIPLAEAHKAIIAGFES